MTPGHSFDLTGKVAIVTGASSGLGVSMAQGLAEHGARVVLAARRLDRLERLAADFEGRGCQVFAIECDVADEGSVDRLVSRTVERFGRADILVNNAGIDNVKPALDESLADFRRVLEVNLVGAFACAQRFGRVMVAQGAGSIINIASILGLVGIGRIPEASYTASKGAVVNLTRELAAQWARKGVRVNAVAPGFFPSEMTRDMTDDAKSQEFVRRHTPMGRMGRAEEIVGPVVFLASDASSYVTGHILAVDGGWTCV